MGALGVLLDSSPETAVDAMMASLTTRDFVIVSVICLKSCYAVHSGCMEYIALKHEGASPEG